MQFLLQYCCWPVQQFHLHSTLHSLHLNILIRYQSNIVSGLLQAGAALNEDGRRRDTHLDRHTLLLQSTKCTTGSYCQQKMQTFHCFCFCPALQRPVFMLKLSHDLHHVKQMAARECYSWKSVITELELQMCNLFLKVLMTFLFQSLSLPLSAFLSFALSLIHLKMDCSVTWTNTLLRAAINTFCQKLQAAPDMSSITIYIKQRAFYDCQSEAGLLRLC